MACSTIVCLDDLLRADDWPSGAFVFDLVRLPIQKAGGADIGRSPRRIAPGRRGGLLAGFSVEQFHALCVRDAPDQPPTLWHALHHRIPDAAASYLLRYLPSGALVLGHHLPPWLTALLGAGGFGWVDLRWSPLRFGSDLIMGLATNRPQLHAAAHSHAMSTDEVAAEARLMAARMRLRSRRQAGPGLPGNPCVFVGQNEDDSALIRADSSVARCTDHRETLHRLARTGPMLYLPHPLAGDFARIEHAAIERCTGQRIGVCPLDGYELLAGDDALTLVGLNAGLLQEAAWFGRSAYTLCPPRSRPVFDATHQPGGCLQIASHVLLSEPLWASLLGSAAREAPLRMPARANQLRELANDWWGYADATQRDSGHLRAGFALAGGQRQGDALRRCERELHGNRDALAAIRREIDQLRVQLDDAAAAGVRAPAGTAIAGSQPGGPERGSTAADRPAIAA